MSSSFLELFIGISIIYLCISLIRTKWFSWNSIIKNLINQKHKASDDIQNIRDGLLISLTVPIISLLIMYLSIILDPKNKQIALYVYSKGSLIIVSSFLVLIYCALIQPIIILKKKENCSLTSIFSRCIFVNLKSTNK